VFFKESVWVLASAGQTLSIASESFCLTWKLSEAGDTIRVQRQTGTGHAQRVTTRPMIYLVAGKLNPGPQLA